MNDPPRTDERGQARPGGRAWAWVSGLVLVAVTATAVVLAGADRPDAPGQGAASAASEAAGREVRARAVLEAAETAYRSGDRLAFLAAAADTADARRWAAVTWRALSDLSVRDLTLRHVAADLPEESSGASEAVSSGASSAVVETSWTQPGWSEPATTSVLVDLDGSGELVGTRAQPDAAAPLWALAPLQVTRTPSTSLVTVGSQRPTGASVRLPRQVRAAGAQVDAVLPPTLTSTTGRLLVVLPRGHRGFRQLLGSDEDYAGIAAVTDSVDGEMRADGAAQVVLNPAVLGRLGPVGTRVVLAHEATHAATGATAGRLPLWVVEGFADFVALHQGGVPVRVAAGRAIADVGRQGLPTRLPGAAAFQVGVHGLGHAYELAWLAFRTVEAEHGAGAVLDFYRRVQAGRSVDEALRASTGAGVDRLTADWRAALGRLARVGA